MEALDDAALEGRRDEAISLSVAAGERQTKALGEADRARDGAKQLGEAAAQDAQLAEVGKSSMKLEAQPNLELLNLELASLSGRPPLALDELAELVLEENASEQLTRIVREHGEKSKASDKAQGKAREAFDAVKKAAAEQELQKVEPELAAAMLANEFKAACSDVGRLLEGLDDRISTTKDNLDKMQTDFEACVTEMANPGATLLMLSFGPTRLRRVIGGVSRTDVEHAFPEWELLSVEPADTAGLGWPMNRTALQWYRLRHHR